MRWIKHARSSEGVENHNFFKSLMDLKSSLQGQKSLVYKMKDPHTIRRILTDSLMYRQPSFALALLYFAVDPTAYEPQVGKSFDRWNWPVTEIEWDLGGIFRILPDKEYLYEGGECKSANTRIRSPCVWLTNTEISDAAYQLERRIRLVDGIMSLGFESRCKYSMKVFVPQIGNPHIVCQRKRSLTVMRRNYSDPKNLELHSETIDWFMLLEDFD